MIIKNIEIIHLCRIYAIIIENNKKIDNYRIQLCILEKGVLEMIRHIVMFQFKEEADGRTKEENLLIAKSMLESLVGVVPTLKNLYVALNHQDADRANYDLVLVSEYEDMEGLNAYQVHEEHKRVSAFIGKVRETRACIDFTF